MQSTPTLTQGEYILSNLRADPLTADNLHRLKNIGSNGQAPVGTHHLTEVRRRSKPQRFRLLRNPYSAGDAWMRTSWKWRRCTPRLDAHVPLMSLRYSKADYI